MSQSLTVLSEYNCDTVLPSAPVSPEKTKSKAAKAGGLLLGGATMGARGKSSTVSSTGPAVQQVRASPIPIIFNTGADPQAGVEPIRIGDQFGVSPHVHDAAVAHHEDTASTAGKCDGATLATVSPGTTVKNIDRDPHLRWKPACLLSEATLHQHRPRPSDTPAANAAIRACAFIHRLLSSVDIVGLWRGQSHHWDALPSGHE